MPLTEAAATIVVQRWEQDSGHAFSAAERTVLAQAFVHLSSVVVSDVVDDVPLSQDQKTAFLAGRAESYLNDWIGRIARQSIRGLGDNIDSKDLEDPASAIGLRSADHQELVDLPVLGEALARKVNRYLATNPDAEMADLSEVSGISDAGVQTLSEVAYIDRPSAVLISPSLTNLARSPSASTIIAVFEKSDVAFVYGDLRTVERRLDAGLPTTVAERLTDLIDRVAGFANAVSFPANGVLASEALAWLKRHEQYRDTLAAAHSGDGSILINGSYVEAAKTLIESAQSKVSLMVFLGTTSASIDGNPAPEALIDALLQTPSGCTVRVILDRDDVGDPYKSRLINRALYDRLKQAGVEVKLDEADELLHSKVLIVDDKSAIVGSHNWTRSGFNSTHELSVLAHQPDLAQAYQQRFDALWARLPDTPPAQ